MNLTNFISIRLIPFLTGETKAPNVNIFNAFYLNWRQMARGMSEALPYVHGVCADVGCGNAPYKKMLLQNAAKYIGVDSGEARKSFFANEGGDFVDGEATALPFADGSIDTVILTQVIEHLSLPSLALVQANRVLKRGGTLIVSAPFIYHAHGVPHDYWRFSEAGLKNMLEICGFEVQKTARQGGFGTTIVSIVNGFVWTQASRNKRLRNFVLLPFLLVFFAVSNAIGLLLDLIDAPEFTPNFLIVARKHT